MRFIIYIFFLLLAFAEGVAVSRKEALKKLSVMHNDLRKNMFLLHFTVDWLKMLQEGKNICSYLIKNNIRTVAVYGVGFLGERLIDELKKTDTCLVYAIDMHRKGEYAGIKIRNSCEQLPIVDAIIVTPVYNYNDIANMLSERTEAEIISLEKMVYTDLYN